MKKQLIGVTLVASLLASNSAFAADREISVALDGKKLNFDVVPQIIDGRTMVPIRAIFEAMGASVDWNSDTQTAVCTKDDITVEMTLGSKTQTVNGKDIEMDIAPVIKNSRTLAPARYVAESFGYNVKWEDSVKRVVITSDDFENSSDYDNISEALDKILDLIAEKDYLKAIQICKSAQSAYHVSPADYALLESLAQEATKKYDDYNSGVRALDEITYEVNQIQSHINSGKYLEAINLCNELRQKYKLNGEAYAKIESLASTATTKYNEYKTNLKTLADISGEINQIQSYINNKKYLEAIELCNNTRKKYKLAPDAANKIEELAQTATSKYNNYSSKLVKSKDDAASIVKAHVTKKFAGLTDPYNKFDVTDAGTHYKVVASYGGNLAVGYQTYYINKNDRSKVTVGVTSKDDACEIVESYVIDTYGGHNFDGFYAYDCGTYYRVVGETWGTSGTMMSFGIWRVSKYNSDDVAEGTSADFDAQNKIFKQEYGIDTSSWN